MNDDEDVVVAAVTNTMNRLRGKLCGLIESWGLPERQERGCIGILKSLSYDAQAEILDAIDEARTLEEY